VGGGGGGDRERGEGGIGEEKRSKGSVPDMKWPNQATLLHLYTVGVPMNMYNLYKYNAQLLDVIFSVTKHPSCKFCDWISSCAIYFIFYISGFEHRGYTVVKANSKVFVCYIQYALCCPLKIKKQNKIKYFIYHPVL
jgi:hypothetical protein